MKKTYEKAYFEKLFWPYYLETKDWGLENNTNLN